MAKTREMKYHSANAPATRQTTAATTVNVPPFAAVCASMVAEGELIGSVLK